MDINSPRKIPSSADLANAVAINVKGEMSVKHITDVKKAFVANIIKKNAETGHITKRYVGFDSMEQARDYLFAGVTILKIEDGYTLERYTGESLSYTDRFGHKIHIAVHFKGGK